MYAFAEHTEDNGGLESTRHTAGCCCRLLQHMPNDDMQSQADTEVDTRDETNLLDGLSAESDSDGKVGPTVVIDTAANVTPPPGKGQGCEANARKGLMSRFRGGKESKAAPTQAKEDAAL